MSRSIVVLDGPVAVDTDSLRAAATVLGWQRRRVEQAANTLCLWETGAWGGASLGICTHLPLALSRQWAALAATAQQVAHRLRTQLEDPLRELGTEISLAAQIYDEAEARAGSALPPLDCAPTATFCREAGERGLVSALQRAGVDWVWRILADRPSTRQYWAQAALPRIAAALEVLEISTVMVSALVENPTPVELSRQAFLVRLAAGAGQIVAGRRRLAQAAPDQVLVRGVGPLERTSLRLSLLLDGAAQRVGRQTNYVDVARVEQPAEGGRVLTGGSARGWPALTYPMLVPKAPVTLITKVFATGVIAPAGGASVVASLSRQQLRAGNYQVVPRVDPSASAGAGRSLPAAGAVAPTPRGASQLLERVDHLRSHPWSQAAMQPAAGDASEVPQAGEFEVLRHDTPGQDRPSWTVVLRGTQEVRVGAVNPKDMTANFATVAGAHSEEQAAVKLALADLGAQPADAVEFVGHSQGGLTAAALAADPQVQSQYRVASVVTAGSPVGNLAVPETTPMLAFENSADFIPGLEGKFNAASQNHVTVYGAGTAGSSFFAPHSLGGYVADAQEAQRRSEPALLRWNVQREQRLGLSESTVTTAHRYTITRTR